MRTVQVSKTVWKKLNRIKKEKGYRVFNQVIKDFVERINGEGDKTLLAGKAIEEVKSNTRPSGPPLPPEITPTNDFEKGIHTFKTLKNENDQARADIVHAKKELQQAITKRIYAQESYKNAVKKTAHTKEILKKEVDDFHSKLDDATQLINNLKSRKNA